MSQSGSFNSTAPVGIIQTIAGDTGSITGANVTIYADQAANNSGATVQFVNSGTVSTFNVTDANRNTSVGKLAGSATFTTTPGFGTNDCYGYNSGHDITIGSFNCLYGSRTGQLITEGNYNVAVGSTALGAVTTGVHNTCVGYNSGILLTDTDSSNVCLSNYGVAGDNGVMRLGNPGEQTSAFMSGVTGVTAAGSPMAVSSTGQVSDLGFGTAAQVLTSNGAGVSPTWQAAGGGAGITQYFSAYLSAPTASVTGDNTIYGPILFDGILSNAGSNYNAATGLFTAPSNGLYSFTHTVAFNGGDALTLGFITIWNGSAFGCRSFQIQKPGANETDIFSACIIIPMTAGDTLGIQALAAGTNKNVQIYGAVPTGVTVTSLFSGFKVA